MKKSPITGRPIPTAPRDWTPNHARRAQARPDPPETLDDAWTHYAQTLGPVFATLSPPALAHASFYMGAASALVVLTQLLEHAPDVPTTQARFRALRDEIVRVATALAQDPDA